MKITETGIKDLVIIEPKIFPDDRGFFYEGFKSDLFCELGFHLDYIQDNVAESSKRVLRGMHLQKEPYAQTKIIRCLSGAIYDVATDLRPGSATYKRSFGIELTGENHKQLFVPRGFAHGYLVLSDKASVMYKVDNIWHRDSEAGFLWNDDAISIDWPNVGELVLSPKDELLPSFKELEKDL